MKMLSPVFVSLLVLGQGALTVPATADVLCVKKRVAVRNGKVGTGAATKVFPGNTCPARFQLVLDTESFRGPAGDDALDPVYGDGSAGDLIVGPGSTTLDQANLNFANIVIQPGGTLSLRSGTVLRCTGSFSNDGTLRVIDFAKGGSQDIPSATRPNPNSVAAGRSDLLGNVAGNGECGDNALTRVGGSGGDVGFVSASPLLPRITQFRSTGGGGGGASHTGSGGDGGGVVYLACAGAVLNVGVISAEGADGSTGAGGGGGGIVVIASGSQINNTGIISVTGGNGGSSSASRGAGGGGAGGAIVLISPSVIQGSTFVAGGLTGSNAIDISSAYRCGGGGGGPSLGFGGVGGGVATNGNADNASSGTDGDAETVIGDPAAILRGL
jgi:hypothetical protein